MGFNALPDGSLIAFCLLILVVFLFRIRYFVRVFSRRKLILWVSLRGAAFLCLLLALLEPQLILNSPHTATLFLVDRSLSVSREQKEAEDYINLQLQNLPSGDQAAVVAFTGETMVELPFTGKPAEIKLATRLPSQVTNIEQALDFCRNYFPSKTNKRLVVFTDGRENTGTAVKALDKLAAEGVNVALYPLQPPLNRDVQLTSMKIPETIHPGEKVPLQVSVNASYQTQGVFSLYHGGTLILQKQMAVKEGLNSFSLPVSIPWEPDNKGILRGEISFQGDTNLQNNSLTLAPDIQDTPQVLVVGKAADTANVNRLLDSLGLKQVHYEPPQLPGTMAFLSAFREVVLVNVSHQDLPQGFENSLAVSVREKGTGLIVVGGENTFALGNYGKTKLEEILPVTSAMQGKKRQPDTGLVLALDCSGSMEDRSGGARKIDLVKEAAVKSAQILESEDYIGVLGFSDVAEWVVPFQQARDKTQFEKQIAGLEPQGGTMIIPALEKGVQALVKAKVKVSHMILLTDGQAEKAGYEALISTLKKEGITFSTVAVGGDADRAMLANLSQAAGGRSYYAENLSEVPEIFVKETYLGTKKYLNQVTFTPQKTDDRIFFKDMSLPRLDGYTGTGLKKGASLILESPAGDPVLAQWSYGLGRVMVWTADLNGRWSGEWIKWKEFQRAWSSIVNACFSPALTEGLKVRLEQAGYDVNILVDTGLVDIGLEKAGSSVEAQILDSRGQVSQVELEPVRPGIFRGHASLDQTGEYILTCTLKDKGQVIKRATRIFYIDYTPEAAMPDERMEAFYTLARDGRINRDTDVFSLPLNKKNHSNQALDFILLPAALGLFIADIGVRKLL